MATYHATYLQGEIMKLPAGATQIAFGAFGQPSARYPGRALKHPRREIMPATTRW
jgi:hypothetical protein